MIIINARKFLKDNSDAGIRTRTRGLRFLLITQWLTWWL